MRVIQSWSDNLNDVIRTVIFQSQELMDLMLIPSDARQNIMEFINKYFINEAIADEVIVSEPVRIVYYHKESREVPGSNAFRRKYLVFDIFCKTLNVHDCDNDRLRSRLDLITQLLIELLTCKRYVCGLRFRYSDDYDQPARVAGYTRHCVQFTYYVTH